MNLSLEFYCKVLEFSIHDSAGEKDSPDWVWLKWDNTDLMLNTAYEKPDRPERPEAARVAAHDDTILYLGCSNVDEAYQMLLSKGFKPDLPGVAPYGMKQLYLHDPDGYSLCFQSPHSNV